MWPLLNLGHSPGATSASPPRLPSLTSLLQTHTHTHTHRTVATDRQTGAVVGQNRQGQGMLGKATLNWGPTWTPDGDTHTCTPTPRPNTGPEAGTLRPPEPTSWGAHSRVETSLDYWRRKCSHRPRRRGSGLLVSPELYSPTHSLSLSTLSQPRAKPVSADPFLPFFGASYPSTQGLPGPSQALSVPSTQDLQPAWRHGTLASPHTSPAPRRCGSRC